MTRRANPDWYRKIAAALEADMPDAVETAMYTVEAEAKDLVYRGHPNHLERRTGALQKSITTNVQAEDARISATVGSSLVYAPVHEFGAAIQGQDGTIRIIPPRPFLIPAFESKRDELKAGIAAAVRRIIRESGI